MKASELAQLLASNAEAVCRHYLPNGRREGRYWRTGDVADTPGRSLYVRLCGPLTGTGAAGRWTDAATGQYGDLIDLVAANRQLDLREALAEARRFLALPQLRQTQSDDTPAPAGSSAARRLFAASQPIWGTLAQVYLRHRGIDVLSGCEALRFHSRCFYRVRYDAQLDARPALIAAITDVDFNITGVHRTWLDPSGLQKARIPDPHRTLGVLRGGGVRFGFQRNAPVDIMAAGEGIETMLSVRMAAPALPTLAALSATHLSSVTLPPTLKRLYIATDDDHAGRRAASTLRRRASSTGVDARILAPSLDDFNSDLSAHGVDTLRERLLLQFAPEDAAFFPAA